MIQALHLFQKIYESVQSKKQKYLGKITSRYSENYELAFKEKPSALQIKRFRQDHILKVGITWFIIITTLFFLL